MVPAKLFLLLMPITFGLYLLVGGTIGLIVGACVSPLLATGHRFLLRDALLGGVGFLGSLLIAVIVIMPWPNSYEILGGWTPWVISFGVAVLLPLLHELSMHNRGGAKST